MQKPQTTSCMPLVCDLRVRDMQVLAESIECDGQNHRHQDVEAIQQSQLRKLRQIANHTPIGAKAAWRQKPAQMAAKKPQSVRRVRIAIAVRIAMMISMMGSPPQRTALNAGSADDGKHKLHQRDVRNARCEK
jgi:hypothetical protein